MSILSLTDCSVHFVGELVDLGPEDMPDNGSGLYVLPQSIQFPGRMMSIEAIGFFTTEHEGFQSNIFLYHRLSNGSFELYYNNTTSHRKTTTKMYTSARAYLNVSVMKGDRIGVQVIPACQGLCPFQPAIRASNCLAQVLYNAENDVNNLKTRTDTFLNIQLSIGELYRFLCAQQTMYCMCICYYVCVYVYNINYI